MIKIGNKRDKFNFPKLVKDAFSFLKHCDYKVEYEDSTLVRFAGFSGKINIYHGRSSYEIGVEFMRNGSETVYPFALLLAVYEGDKASRFQNPSATTPEAVKKYLQMQADLLKKYGSRIFLGDKNIWNDFDNILRKNSYDLEISTKLSQARRIAYKAFQEKRFKDVVHALESIEDWLTPTEIKKLAYARNHS